MMLFIVSKVKCLCQLIVEKDCKIKFLDDTKKRKRELIVKIKTIIQLKICIQVWRQRLNTIFCNRLRNYANARNLKSTSDQ